MTIFRTDEEVALNDLLVATREAADHYQDAVEYLDDEQIGSVLREIIQRRNAFIGRIEHAIRTLGDLPSVPDPDRETGEMLIHHVAAALSSDTSIEILEQRIKAERHLIELVAACRAVGLDKTQGALLTDMEQDVNNTIGQLQQLEA